MIFPKVKKRFSRLAPTEKLSRATVKLVGAALIAAALGTADLSELRAETSLGTDAVATALGRVIVLPAAPAVSVTEGTTAMAAHYSHSSHASHSSHVSHASHCSSFC